MKTEIKALLYIFLIGCCGGLIVFGLPISMHLLLGWELGAIGLCFVLLPMVAALMGILAVHYDDFEKWVDSRNKPKKQPTPGAWKEES